MGIPLVRALNTLPRCLHVVPAPRPLRAGAYARQPLEAMPPPVALWKLILHSKSSPQPHEADTVLVPILQMKTQRLREEQ